MQSKWLRRGGFFDGERFSQWKDASEATPILVGQALDKLAQKFLKVLSILCQLLGQVL